MSLAWRGYAAALLLALVLGSAHAYAQNQPVQLDPSSCTAGAVPVWVANQSGAGGAWYCSSSRAASALPTAPGGAMFNTGAGATSGALAAIQVQAQLFNIRGYGAKGDGATDDSVALSAAIAAANTAMAVGINACVYAPSGNYLIGTASAIPSFSTGKPGCVIGDGPQQSKFTLAFAFTGDLFSWAEAWIGAGNIAGPLTSGFSVYGNPSAPGQQNAFMFYDREDQVLIRDVDVWNLPGRAFYSGVLKTTSQSYMRESRIRSFRVFASGTASVPAVEFSSEGGAGTDGTNEIDILQMDVYGSPGKAMVIRNNSQGVVRNFRVSSLRLEGLNLNVSNTGDLLTIGDDVMTGQVNTLQFNDFEAEWIYTSSYGIRTKVASGAIAPYNVWFNNGFIGAGPGGGVRVDAGRDILFRFSGIAVSGTSVTIGAAPAVGTNITVDGNGSEKTWTYSIDSSSTSSTRWPLISSNNPTLNAIVPRVGSVIPTAPGAGSTDFQGQRTLTSHVAGGDYSTIGGGESNQANGIDSTVSGGTQQRASGFRSSICGGAFNFSFGQYSFSCGLGSTADGNHSYAWGNNSNARTTNGKWAFSSSNFAAQGDAQMGYVVNRAATSSTSSTRLTSDGLAAGSGNSSNTVNIPTGTVYHTRVSGTCRDTTNGDWAGWNTLDGWLVNTAGTVTYVGGYTAGTTPSQSGGAGSTATLTLAADNTNKGLSIAVVMPNSHAWHCVAKADTPEEVQ